MTPPELAEVVTNRDAVQPARLLDSMAEIHALTRLRRNGWVLAGVRESESVSDHCFEAAILAFLIAEQIETRVDMGRILAMLLFHELGETRLTDLPRRAAPYVKGFKREAERAIADDVIDGVSRLVPGLLAEFEAGQTIEARIAESAEELQILFAALMYARDGNGDMSEYLKDVDSYDDLGVPYIGEVSALIGQRLAGYLNGKPHWSIGYSRADDSE